MTPVNLGQLPTDQPAPLGQGQVKPGVTDGTTNYNNTSPNGYPLTDAPSGGGNPMRLSLTPQYDCWWRVTALGIWTTGDAAWTRADWGIDLAPADADGYSRTTSPVWMHSATSWEHSRCTALFRLKAGIVYTATAVWISSDGYGHQVWNGSTYWSITGHTIAEGRI